MNKKRKLLSALTALTLTASAFTGLAVPASAEGEYYTQNYESAELSTASGTDKVDGNITFDDGTMWDAKWGKGYMSIVQDTNTNIAKYFKFAVGGASGGRATLCDFGTAAETVDSEQRSVFEMDFYMSGNGGGSQIVLTNTSTYGRDKTNTALTGDYAVALYQTDKNEVAVGTLDNADGAAPKLDGYTNGTWAHLKAVMNFKEDTVVMKITSLDGEKTFLEENKFAMSGDISSASRLVIFENRNLSASCGIDNVVFRPYVDGDIEGTYYMATLNVDGKTYTRTADKTTGLISDLPDTTKTGYIFDGWNKDDDTTTVYSTEQILATKLEADVTYTAVYHKNPDYIEPLTSLEFSSFPANGQPVMGESADEFASNEIQVKLVGELGNDLLAADNRDARVKDPEITWSFNGFRTIVSDGGRATSESTDAEGNPTTYCDTYAQVVYDETDPTKVDFRQKKHNFNFYGEVVVTVKYGEPADSTEDGEKTAAKTLTLKKPMVILPNNTVVLPEGKTYNGLILPKAGYASDFSLYEDTMIGYTATREPTNKDTTDIVTGDWVSSYGSNATNSLYMASDDEGETKFLRLETTVSSGSSFATNKLSSAPEGQVIISQDVRFGAVDSEILLKSLAPTNWNAGATTLTLKLTSSGFTLNGGPAFATTATTGQWYHIVLSADVTSKLCYAKVYDMDGKLLGESDVVGFSDAASLTPVYLMYRIKDSTASTLDFNNVIMYVPEIAGELTTTISNDTLIIPTDELDEGINYKNDTVTVKKSDAQDDDEATLIYAEYAGGQLISAAPYTLKFKDGLATQALHAAKGSKLMVWDSLEGMKPIVAEPLSVEDDADANVATLTVDALSTDGYSMIGDAEWSVVDSMTKEASDFVKLDVDKSNSHKATLTVLKGASSGTYDVTVSLGGKTKTITVTVTGTQESVKFTKSTSSISIPLEDGLSNTYEYSAIVVDKNNKDLGKTVTYAMYDKNNEKPLENTDAISFDAEKGILTVTSAAKGSVVYIRATSTNSDDDTISRALKVTIHGLAFDFGTSAATAEGYTAVAPDTSYSDASGYGLASGTPMAGGTGSTEDADSDYLEGAFTFQAKVEPGKVYAVTVNGDSTNFTTENLGAGLTGAASSGLSKTEDGSAYLIAVTDDILDMTFASGSKVSSIVIEKQPDKNKGSKPTIFTVGDSTLSNNGSWAYVISHESFPTLTSIANFQCNGQGSQNLDSFYTGGQLMSRVLVNIAPGDYVTIGNMGTNGMGVNFEQAFNSYVDACIAMGAKVIINSYSPHGAVGEYANTYDSTTHTFDTYRKDSYDNIVRKIYEERSTVDGEKYDENVVGFMDIGVMADDAFNAFVADYVGTTMKFAVGEQGTKTAYADENAAAAAIIACFGDHNHYGDSGKGLDRLASNLMVRGYEAVGERKGAIGIVNRLIEIVSADLAKAPTEETGGTSESGGNE